MNFTYPYRAVICGKEHIVRDCRNGKLITKKGEFVFEPLFDNQEIYTSRILEIISIQSDGNGKWLYNGYKHDLLTTLPAGNRFRITGYEDLRVYEDEICAAAWILENDTVDVTHLLDVLAKTWKIVSQPNELARHLTPNLQMANSIADALSYFTIFKDWGNPIWLKKFHRIDQIAKPVEVEVISLPPQKILTVTENEISIMQKPKMIEDKKAVVAPEKSLPDFFFSIQSAATFIGVSKRTILNWKKRGWLKVEQNGKKIRIARTDLEKCKNRQ